MTEVRATRLRGRARLALALAAAVVAAAAIAHLSRYGVLPIADLEHAALPAASLEGPIASERPRVLLIGTSLTAEAHWPEALEASLSRCARRSVAVERLARAGATSAWGLAALEKRLGDASRPPPDIAVIEFGINDARLIRGEPLSASRRNHQRMIDRLRARGAIVLLATMNPGWGPRGMLRLGLERYRLMYAELARAPGVDLIDTAPRWRALSGSRRRALTPDGVHPSKAGWRRITLPAMESALRPLLCDASAFAR